MFGRRLLRARSTIPPTASRSTVASTLLPQQIPLMSDPPRPSGVHSPPCKADSEAPQAHRRHPYAVNSAHLISAVDAASASQKASTRRIIRQGFMLWRRKATSFLTRTLGDAKYEPDEVQEALKRTQNISVNDVMGFGPGGTTTTFAAPSKSSRKK